MVGVFVRSTFGNNDGHVPHNSYVKATPNKMWLNNCKFALMVCSYGGNCIPNPMALS